MSMVLTSKQIKEVEQKAVDMGLGWLRLMENAGSAAAKEIRDKFSDKNLKIVILCGKGNNGGDGYVIARKLTENFNDIKVIAVGLPSTDSAKEMAAKAINIGINPIQFDLYQSTCLQSIANADVIIDAMLGIGLKGEPEGDYAIAISSINSSKAYKIAIDVPSGIMSDNVRVTKLSLKADLTITFTAFKMCQFLTPASKYCGVIKYASIGIPNDAYSGIEPAMQVVTDSLISPLLPVREQDCHKGLCGTAGLFVGNTGYSGAAVLAGKAAVKSGVGIANMIIPESIYNIVGVSIPEAVCTVLKGDSYETIHENDADKIISALKKCNAALVGCGLGRGKHIKSILKRILKECNIPLVIDADGINELCDCIELIKQYKGSVILTPHPKEASRLLGCSVDDVQNDRLYAVTEIAARTGAITVLKGANSLIAYPTGRTFVVSDGNPGMATAGSGDMLSGIMVALLAQGLVAEIASVCAVKIHAMAGDEALKNSSVLSLTPSDMIYALPTVYNRLYFKK